MRLQWLASSLILVIAAGVADAGDGVWPRFQAGVKAYRRGDSKVAEARFEAVIKADPKFGDAYYYLGALQERKAATRAAVRMYKSVEKKWPTYVLSQERLGQIALKMKDLKSAEHYFEVVVKVRPDVEAWLQLGGVQLDLGKYEGAERSFVACGKISKNNLDLIELQARLYSETDRPQKAYDAYSAILKAMPHDTTVRYLRALCSVELDRQSEAVKEMEKVLETDPFHGGALKHLLGVYENDPSREKRVAVIKARLERLRKNPPKVREVSGTRK